MTDTNAVNIGSARQLFIDRFLVGQLTGASHVMHRPTPRNRAIGIDHPWEMNGVSYMVTFRDDDRFRAWYRCTSDRTRTAYAESADGVTWTKPSLGICEFEGSRDNNLVIDDPNTVNVAPFKDLDASTADDRRYKAIARHKVDGIYTLASPDGLHWRRQQPIDQPLMTTQVGPFDSHNIAFHDPWTGQYVMYTRGVELGHGRLGHSATREFRHGKMAKGVRWIRRSVSDDFLHWSPLEPITTGDAPLEQFYTNACVPYERSRGLYLMFPSRFVDARTPDPDWPRNGLNDGVFMSSRDGLAFDRSFLEAWVRPGPGCWHDRSVYIERGVLATGDRQLSMFALEQSWLPTCCIRRHSLRTDGFASIAAPYAGGELVTRPLLFEGDQLRVNLSTSATGSLQVEVQDVQGRALPGFGLGNSPPVFADEIDLPVCWSSGRSLAEVAGAAVRLRFVLVDADLYAFRFCAGEESRDSAGRPPGA